MKIETTVRTHAGHSVRYSKGIEVTYDTKGVAEVPDEVGGYLIEKYTDSIFLEGKVIQPMTRNNPPALKTDGSSAELKEQLQRANSLIGSYKTQLEQAKDGERVWRLKCEELLVENKALKKQIGEKTLNGIADTKGATDEETTEAIRKKLTVKTKDELLGIANEMDFPKEEFQNLSKIKLVEYLVKKTTTKNANT